MSIMVYILGLLLQLGSLHAFCLPGLFLDSVVAHELVEDEISTIKSLINLPQNKAIFSPLKYSENAFFDPSTDRLGSLDFVRDHLYQTQPYVANGYFGARIPNIGHGFAYDRSYAGASVQNEELKNGWPLFNQRFAGAFVAGFFNSQKNTTGYNFPWIYKYGWDSVISAIPQWTYLSIASEGFVLDPARPVEMWGNVTNYMQNLSLENGIVSTLFTWLGKLEIQYDVSANKHNINLGTITLTVRNPSREAILIAVNDTIDYRTSHRCRFVSSRVDEGEGIQMIVTPNGVNDVYGAIYSRLYLNGDHANICSSKNNKLDVSREIETVVYLNERLEFVKLVGVYTSDVDPKWLNLSEVVLLAAKEVAMQSNPDELLQLHDKAWATALGKTSLIKFPDSPLLTMASKASVYHINANMRAGAEGLSSALSVSGLSSDSYGGQVFWDTDLWILMGILPFNPHVSKSLLNYRLYGRLQAINNIRNPSRSKNAFAGAVYPWTSGRFGNCTATGPCFDYEYHINAAISYSAVQLYLSGAVDENYLESVIYPIVFDAALFFSTYLQYDERLLQYISKNLTDPDEFAEFVDNGAYTNAAISMTIRWAITISKHLGKSVPSSFTNIIEHIHIPFSPDDEELVLEYSGMNSSISVKQADVIMMSYPLENELIAEELALKNLMYYASRQVSTGPAMTFLIFSIVSSAILDSGCSSESYLLKSLQPFLRGPFAQFLEQSDDNFETNGGTHPAFPFLTAHGGFLQTILMGILGMRFSYELRGEKIHRVLVFKARNLSLFPNGVKFEEVQYMNTSLSIKLEKSLLIVENNGPIVGSAESDLEIKVVSYSNRGSRELQVLENGRSIIFDVSSRANADPESLTECGLAFFMSLGAGEQGDVVDLMHDGDNSTFWQASSSDETRILIDLKERKSLEGGYINWGDAPARYLQIYAQDGELGSDDEMRHFDREKVVTWPPGVLADSEIRGAQRLKIQDHFFRAIYTDEVQITEPFDPVEYKRVEVPKRHNVTRFEFLKPVECRRLVIKFGETHNNHTKGAKIYDVNLYKSKKKDIT